MTDHRAASEIEAELELPRELVQASLEYCQAQNAARGEWPDPRKTRQPNAPWPAAENAMLKFLLEKCYLSIQAGMDAQQAVLQLAVHAWFEGGVENYDRGQRDARSSQ